MEQDLEDFRVEVRAFLKEKLSPELAERARAGFYLSKQELFGWQQALYKKGWIGLNWPKEYGGPDWSPMQKYIFEDECAQAGAPILITLGLNQAGALLINFGTDEQKKRHLQPILDGTQTWCQGFSEPGSGSDLASLKCAAVRDRLVLSSCSYRQRRAQAGRHYDPSHGHEVARHNGAPDYRAGRDAFAKSTVSR